MIHGGEHLLVAHGALWTTVPGLHSMLTSFVPTAIMDGPMHLPGNGHDVQREPRQHISSFKYR